uniref:Major facilitator superfamily (MFS) profile domain-containing protein n=1 Tax=Leersia perrieri TaxID=77586 RepID=A0A0D9XD39_9ORYZ
MPGEAIACIPPDGPRGGEMGGPAAAWEKRRTLLLMNLASIMERADEALLPAVYREVGAALHATPTGLGALTLCRSAVQAACYPLAAYTAVRHNRAHVIAVGAFLWAAATFLVAVSGIFIQRPQWHRPRAGHPVDSVAGRRLHRRRQPRHAGTAFGWLQLTSSIGSIIGGFSALLLASTTVLGADRWRVAFHLVAVAALVWLFAVDPHFSSPNPAAISPAAKRRRSAWEEAREMISEARDIFVAQGVSGSFAWSALSFMSMWLELVGFSHGETAALTTVFAVATSLGGLVGGMMGDALAAVYPDAGRIVLSQISAGSAVLLLALPDDPSSGIAHCLVLLVMGLIISWNAAATNNPIFAEIVPERSRTSIYALDRSFESILASFAPPVVGLVSQHVYGFKPAGVNGGERDRENAASLAKALYSAIAIPMAICSGIYLLLYRTYPRDRDRARAAAAAACDLEMQQHTKKKQRRRRRQSATLLLAYAALAMERADATLLPAVYREIGVALQASPSALGSIALSRSVVQAACYPLAAYLATRHDRLAVVALGAFLWAAATLLIAVSATFHQMAVAAALNGVGLALQIPAIYAFVADSVDGTSRGMAFGWLMVAGKVGTVGGTSLGLLMAPTSFLGIPGWRLAFLLLAAAGAAVGVSIRCFAAAAGGNATAATATANATKTVRHQMEEFAREAKSVLRVPSFQVIVAQGLTGSFPWSALSFTAMWLELVGFTHGETAALMAVFKLSTSLGALVGGKMGDALSRRFRDTGRVVLAQVSSGSAVPLAAVLLLALPIGGGDGENNPPPSAVRHGAALFALGIMASWNPSSTNGPILAEIVPARSRTSVYALDRTCEAVLASFAPPVVGVLAERVYGYEPPACHAGAGAVDVETERRNAASLARALYTAIAVPMVLCCLIYSFLYCTYPKDREMAARAEAAAAAAARDEGGDRLAGGEGSDIEDEGEDDERKLLPH